MLARAASSFATKYFLLHAHSSLSGYSGLIFELLLGCAPCDTRAVRAYAPSAPDGVNASANATTNVAVLSYSFCVSPASPAPRCTLCCTAR